MFDKTWAKGEGAWVRTEKRLGRNMDWLANVVRVGVRGAWTKPRDRPRLHNAVLGGWLGWEGVEGDHRPVTAEPGTAAEGGVHGAEAPGCAEVTESVGTERRGPPPGRVILSRAAR